MHNFVLIHSTGQAAAGWDRLAAHLRAEGAAVHAMDLPNDPLLRAQDFAQLLAEAFGEVESPIVLAHSGAGPLLPAAATALAARLQVWLAAWVPDPELTFLEDARAHLEEAFEPGWIGQDPVSDDAAAQQFLYHDADAEALGWALTTRREFFPEGVYDERIGLNPRIPSIYVGATEDRTILPAWQEQMARERLGVEPIMMNSGHCPNVSRPRELSELLIRAAAGF